MKTCRKCQCEQPDDAFAKNQVWCRGCWKQYRHDNADEIRTRNRAYQQANRDKTRQWVKECDARHRMQRKRAKQRHYDANRAEIVAKRRKWRAANKERLTVYAAVRDFRDRTNPIKDFTPAHWLELLHENNYACVYCGSTEQVQMDHKIPVSRGGGHTKANIAPACKRCNRCKGALTDAEFREFLALYPEVLKT